MRRVRGFTLIELMVTIAVLAIIAVMAAPSFSNMIAKQQLNTTTQDLISTLNEARSQAVLKRTTITVHLNSTSTNTDTDYYWSAKTNNTLTNPSSLTSIAFSENGTTSSITTETSFVICNSTSNTTKTFSLSIMGTVYVTPASDGTC